MRPIFKIEMSINWSKANLNEKILLGRITHQVDLEIGKMLAKCMFVNEDSTFHPGL